MTQDTPLFDYLVLSRGKWREDKSPQQIQAAIDEFYPWYDRLLAEGRIKPGQRLARESRLVSQGRVIDGPFTETKEVIGGYWFFVAASLDDAVALAAQNPCLACGLSLEVRPLDLTRASALAVTNETPGA